MPLLLSESDVRELVSMRDLIALMETTLADFSQGKVEQPVRTVLGVGAERNFFGVMPAYLPSLPAMGAKLVTVYPANPAKQLPSHLATIVLLDPETGALRALVDGRYITEARTAAVSAVSVRLLARGDSKTLAILGSGVQARSHAEALREVFGFEDVRVWSPNPEARGRVAAEAGARAADSAEEAVRGADVVALVTSSRTPVIEDEWVKEGAHVISVGACRPTEQEMDPALVRRGLLYVDSRAAAERESGDVIAAGAEHIQAELGDLAAGRTGGRTSPAQITIFKSLGLAVEDIASADLAYRRAAAAGKGKQI